MTLRQDKLNALFKKLIAQFLGPRVEDAVTTVTQCIVSRDTKNARVYIAVYPPNKEKVILEKIREKQKDLQDFLRKNTRMKFTPRVIFSIDQSAEKIEKISKLLDIA